MDAVASTIGLGTALEDSTTIEAVGVTAPQAPGDPTGEPLFGLR
ncbi:hypothetical protein ACFO1B_15195 [Dactylosporangium siamense]|uniref:Uncharacterized protein n=1 Tax=Dactylosporangium siamense TaxID=685454 RepID=A0A919PHX9_9ACTN|nr:hypothetical protein [Dactylosporangium siamense]GIG45180.1 hypothetical protein Dsi01nite_032210 [Dactylosporangium siamense]